MDGQKYNGSTLKYASPNTTLDECITLQNKTEPQGMLNQEISCTYIIYWKHIK